MYLKKVHIQNIKSIQDFEMEFEEPAGWHVLIGDNGSGKSTIIRSIALGLIGVHGIAGLRADWNDWLRWNEDLGKVNLTLTRNKEDGSLSEEFVHSYTFSTIVGFERRGTMVLPTSELLPSSEGTKNPAIEDIDRSTGWFSAAYGPFRRFTGGNPEWQKVFASMPRLGAHLSVFGEDVALTEAIEWLQRLQFQKLEKHQDDYQLDCLRDLINSEDFLPNGMKLESVSSEGVKFRDGHGALVSVNELSDGFRSILSMTFELLRQLTRSFGPKTVFKAIRHGEMIIDLPGIVLIDEIDVHLHPNWQLRIGQWLTKYFPRLQFIVTTHSPLICRASEQGSIWRLAARASDEESGRISKIDADRLIFGNILDAYGTEVFGSAVVRSEKSDEKLSRLGRLNMLAAYGKITHDEETERRELQLIFTTDDPAS